MNTGHMGSETSPNSDSLASDIILHGHINQSPVLEPKRQHTVNRVQYSNSFLNDNPGSNSTDISFKSLAIYALKLFIPQ